MSYRDDPAWRSALGETNEQCERRRAAQKDVAAFLRSDLYEPDHLAAEAGEVYWRSPLNWVVRFQVEATTWRCVILDPAGGEYARLEEPTSSYLDAVLP